jgi:hypothetical protein
MADRKEAILPAEAPAWVAEEEAIAAVVVAAGGVVVVAGVTNRSFVVFLGFAKFGNGAKSYAANEVELRQISSHQSS